MLSPKTVVMRKHIKGTHVRLVLRHIGFQSQELVLGIDLKVLRKALFLDWVMRFYREGQAQYCMPDPDMEEDHVLGYLNQFVRNNGLQSHHHRYVEYAKFAPRPCSEILIVLCFAYHCVALQLYRRGAGLCIKSDV